MGWRADGTQWHLLKGHARAMRRTPTEAEDVLWQRLRRSQLGVRFRHQFVIGWFVVDFYCPARKLVIEVDGDAHDAREERDDERTRRLDELGISVVRFPNRAILFAIDSVLTAIRDRIE